ncbi:hypothetical protein E1295_08605 [Nonomuraea mesophila]|uniref:Uncharacterized protein n=1 Tax=Nonomuraea mesophila TaxID=2530382 RepID=A0A4R5FUR3_9ACTN|nr:hypothetical protein [Nonomuraea mesophila]TDE57179.1 hypothetical protein E1295_08605 [Nonomuraea mesophila]
MYRTSYEVLEGNSENIRLEGEFLIRATEYLREEVYRLQEYFGNPSTDEVARVFRNGQDGQPGFDQMYNDLDEALQNIQKSYAGISATLNAMSTTVREADGPGTIVLDAVEKLVAFSTRTNDSIAVPTTQARHH